MKYEWVTILETPSSEAPLCVHVVHPGGPGVPRAVWWRCTSSALITSLLEVFETPNGRLDNGSLWKKVYFMSDIILFIRKLSVLSIGEQFEIDHKLQDGLLHKSLNMLSTPFVIINKCVLGRFCIPHNIFFQFNDAFEYIFKLSKCTHSWSHSYKQKYALESYDPLHTCVVTKFYSRIWLLISRKFGSLVCKEAQNVKVDVDCVRKSQAPK